jgi:hypothetical protein
MVWPIRHASGRIRGKAGHISLSNGRHRVWYPAVERAGPQAPLYQMRDTFATLALAAGIPIDFVSRQMGHTDIRTTLRFYARYIPALEEPPGHAERGLAGDGTDRRQTRKRNVRSIWQDTQRRHKRPRRTGQQKGGSRADDEDRSST